MLMSKIVHFSSILTLTSPHHLTLTMKDLKNIFAVSMDDKTWNNWNRPIDSGDIIFSGFLPDFSNYKY